MRRIRKQNRETSLPYLKKAVNVCDPCKICRVILCDKECRINANKTRIAEMTNYALFDSTHSTNKSRVPDSLAQ